MQRTHHFAMPATLDPANLTLDEKKILTKILRENDHLSFFSTERIFALQRCYSASIKLYHLTKDILPRDCNPAGKHFKQQRYEIINPAILGEGIYGEVRQSLATIRLMDNGSLLFKKPVDLKQRVIKKFIIGPGDSPVDIIRFANYEYSLMKRMDHLHAKPPAFTSDGIYIVMRKMPGINLGEFLKRERNGSVSLTLSQRFKLALSVAQALQKQVHDKDIMHRDFGIKNIMVEKVNDEFTINIIDLGFASDVNQINDVGLFNVVHQYLAPELRAGHAPTSIKSDIYSLARAISEILRFSSSGFSQIVFTTFKEQLEYEESCGIYLNGMFEGLYDVNASIAKRIYSLLKSMGCYQPSERISLASVIRELEELHQYALEREMDIRCSVL